MKSIKKPDVLVGLMSIVIIASCRSVNRLLCPLEKGRILYEETKGAEPASRLPLAMLISESPRVISMLRGKITLIDSVNSKYSVSVTTGDTLVIYGNLSAVGVHTGQSIKKKQFIGSVGSNDTLTLHLIKNGLPLYVEKLLRCRTKYVYHE